jgi:hypothetical protein
MISEEMVLEKLDRMDRKSVYSGPLYKILRDRINKCVLYISKTGNMCGGKNTIMTLTSCTIQELYILGFGLWCLMPNIIQMYQYTFYEAYVLTFILV